MNLKRRNVPEGDESGGPHPPQAIPAPVPDSDARLPDVGLSGRAATELRELSDDVCQRLRSVDLVRARPTQQRLNLCQVAQHELPLCRRLPIRVGRACLDAAEENVRRSTQQDNGIEAVVEATLVGDCPET